MTHRTQVRKIRRWGLWGRRQWLATCDTCEWVGKRADEKKWAVAQAAGHEVRGRKVTLPSQGGW